MSASPFALLNLASLLNQDASIYEIESEGQLLPEKAQLEADGIRLNEALEYRLIVRGTGGDDDFILEGHVSGTALLECRRCLDEVATKASSSFVYPMMYKPGTEGLRLADDDSEEDDVLIFGQPEVDFAELLTQLFAIELPLTVLCRDDCKGLSVDGVNLNHHPDHQTTVSQVSLVKESPFAILKDIEL
jgi:uncharacterized protein